MTLKLKPLLTELCTNQSALAAHLSISRAAMNQIVNLNQWPKGRGKAEIKNEIGQFLQQKGAAPAEIATAFEKTESSRSHAKTPSGTSTNALVNTLEETMLLRKQGLTPDARKYFDLPRDPFSGDVQAHDDVFVTPDIRYVREAMFQAARHGGFMAVVGESGSGKSTLRRDLLDRIQRESHPVILIEPYVLGMEDNDIKGKTLKASHIAESILAACAPLVGPKRSPEARFAQVHKALRESHRSGMRHVLIIEEAHGLPIPTLKHLKRFFELEDGFKKLLSIILIGQTELATKLSESNFEVREVVQRCEVVQLAPLDAELDNYLNFKLGRIGKKAVDVIDAQGIAALRDKLMVNGTRRSARETISLLYPLAVNNLLTAAMNFAAEMGVPKVTADVIRGV